jgi:hypothetical protein
MYRSQEEGSDGSHTPVRMVGSFEQFMRSCAAAPNSVTAKDEDSIPDDATIRGRPSRKRTASRLGRSSPEAAEDSRASVGRQQRQPGLAMGSLPAVPASMGMAEGSCDEHVSCSAHVSRCTEKEFLLCTAFFAIMWRVGSHRDPALRELLTMNCRGGRGSS